MRGKKTLILETSTADLEKAAGIIRRGGLVVFPTETVYGLGANALDAEACAGIFAAKGRPGDNPLIVHLPDVFSLASVTADIPPEAAVLAEAFMPGPLTIILTKNSVIPDRVTAGLPTVGLRVPEDAVAREFLRLAGVLVAAPSANLSGRPSPTTFEMAMEAMDGRADAVIRGGVCEVGLESTILRVAEGNVEILRPGKIGEKEILSVLKKSRVLGHSASSGDGPPAAPGMKYTHYKPRAEVFLFSGDAGLESALRGYAGQKIGVLSIGARPQAADREKAGEEIRPDPAEQSVIVKESAGIEEYARRLYAEFFVFDKLGCRIILAYYPPQEGLGRAVGNRLLKASGGRFIGPRP